MRELLFLVHRIPDPPDKGDKVRAWNILPHLTRRYPNLGCFIVDPHDWQYREKLKEHCGECHFVRLQPNVAKLRSVVGLFKGAALTPQKAYQMYRRHNMLMTWPACQNKTQHANSEGKPWPTIHALS